MTIKKGFKLPLVLSGALLSLIMFFFILFTAEGVGIQREDVLLTSVLFSAVYLGATMFFVKEQGDRLFNLVFIWAAVAALIYMRVALLSHPARDYNVFLSDWLSKMRELDGVEPLVQKIGDYNMPYLYFLFIISKLKLNDLILIKWLSCIFDLLAAVFMMKIVSLKSKSTVLNFSAFILTLALPTVLLNGSYWGQCDSILAALCIGSIYFILKGKTSASIVLYALAFSFKLQAVFILPFMIVLCIIKKASPIKLLLFPAVFLATLLPALFAGRPFIDCIRIYFDQAGQYPYMSLNSPSLWQIFENAPIENFNSVAVMLSGLVVISLIAVCLKYKDRIDLSAQVELAYLSAVLIPFFLPRMHDRYFFIADILSLGVFFFKRKKWYVPFVTQLASLNCYSYYLFGGALILPYNYATLALFVVLVISLKDFVIRISGKEQMKI